MRKIERIVIVSDFALSNGGAAKVAIENAIELAQIGYEIIFFAAVGPVDERLRANPAIETICLASDEYLDRTPKIQGALHGLWDRHVFEALSEILHKCDPSSTVVHIHSWTKALSASIFSALKGGRFQIFLTVHDYFLVCPNGGLYDYRKKRLCGKRPLSLKCLACNCDKRSYFQKVYRCLRLKIQQCSMKRLFVHAVYLSEFSKSHIVRYWHQSHDSTLVPNPVVTYDSLSYPEMPDEKIALFVGRLSEEKGLDLFCEAFLSSDWQGVVIGDGPLRADYAKRYPSIRFEGWSDQKKLFSWFCRAAFLVFPSRCLEVSPLTIPEAQKAAFLPAVVSDGCAGRDQISEGATGELFCSGDIESLRSVIADLEWEHLRCMRANIFEIEEARDSALPGEMLSKCYESSIDTDGESSFGSGEEKTGSMAIASIRVSRARRVDKASCAS